MSFDYILFLAFYGGVAFFLISRFPEDWRRRWRPLNEIKLIDAGYLLFMSLITLVMVGLAVFLALGPFTGYRFENLLD